MHILQIEQFELSQFCIKCMYTKLPRNWRCRTTLCNQNRKWSGRPRCTTEQVDKYIRVSSVRNRRLTSPQLAASLNSTCKTPASTSTVKRQLRDAGLLDRVAKKKTYLRLANKKKRLRWAKEHRHWTEELWLEGQHPGVASSLLTLRLVFCGYYLMKLPVEDMWGICFSN